MATLQLHSSTVGRSAFPNFVRLGPTIAPLLSFFSSSPLFFSSPHVLLENQTPGSNESNVKTHGASEIADDLALEELASDDNGNDAKVEPPSSTVSLDNAWVGSFHSQMEEEPD